MRLILLSLFTIAFLFSCSGPVEEVPHGVVDSSAIKKKKKTGPELKAGLFYGVELKKGQRNQYAESEGKLGDTLFYSSYKGKIEMSDTIDRKRTFLFDMKAEYMVDKVFIIPLGDQSWFVAVQETDHNGIKTNFARYKTGAANPEWIHSIYAPYPSQPVMDGDVAYVTTLGMVGKLNVAEGKFLWKYDSLYNQIKLAYQKFERPLVYDDKVVFVDYPVPGKRDKRDTITVDPATGKWRK